MGYKLVQEGIEICLSFPSFVIMVLKKKTLKIHVSIPIIANSKSKFIQVKDLLTHPKVAPTHTHPPTSFNVTIGH